MEKAYDPSSERLMVMGNLLETSSNLPCTLGSCTTEGIVGIIRVGPVFGAFGTGKRVVEGGVALSMEGLMIVV